MKEMLLEILDYYRYKLEHDKCTPEDMRAAFDIIGSNMACDATIKDISAFYGQSESNVRNVISRKCFKKPKRVVMYDFQTIRELVPKTWHRR